jgi:hypothetical protein
MGKEISIRAPDRMLVGDSGMAVGWFIAVLDWIGRGETAMSIFGGIPGIGAFLTQPLIGIALVLAGFYWIVKRANLANAGAGDDSVLYGPDGRTMTRKRTGWFRVAKHAGITAGAGILLAITMAHFTSVPSTAARNISHEESTPPVSIVQKDVHGDAIANTGSGDVIVNKAYPNAWNEYYFPDGTLRMERGGTFKPLDHTKVPTYQKIVALNHAKNWQTLAEVCEAEIAAIPLWLTPYYYGSIARWNLGNRETAIGHLEYFRSKAEGDPYYTNQYEDSGQKLEAMHTEMRVLLSNPKGTVTK